MAIGYTVLSLLKPDGKSEIVANFFLVNVWHYEWWTGINPVAWSLACEAFFYACFPFLYAVLRRLGPKALATLVAACILTEMVLPAVSRALDTGVVLYCFPPTRLLEFVLGIAAARLVQLGRWRGPGLEGATALTVVGFFMAPQFTGAYACTTVLGFTLLIAAGAVADINGLPSMWRSRPMVKLGEWSFAFYMVHVLVLEVLRRVVGNHPQLETLPAVGSTALAFILSLALAAALYRFVELPGQRLVLGRRKGSNRPA
jgi:peptidoglycan/LPS O-acetylase OafA/YrhL